MPPLPDAEVMELDEDREPAPYPGGDWREAYIRYLLHDTLPADRTEARRLARLLVFLNVHRIIRKRTEDIIVALHPEVFRVS